MYIIHRRNGGHEITYSFTPDEYKILASQIKEANRIGESYLALTKSQKWQDMTDAQRDLRRLEIELSYLRFYSRACGLGTGVSLGVVASSVYTMKIPNVYSAAGLVIGGGIYFGTSYCEEILEDKIETLKENVEKQKDKVRKEGSETSSNSGGDSGYDDHEEPDEGQPWDPCPLGSDTYCVPKPEGGGYVCRPKPPPPHCHPY